MIEDYFKNEKKFYLSNSNIPEMLPENGITPEFKKQLDEIIESLRQKAGKVFEPSNYRMDVET